MIGALACLGACHDRGSNPLKLKAGIVLCKLALIMLIVAAPIGAASEALRVGGSGSTLGTAKLIGDAFSRQHPTTTLRIVPNLGSGGALKALAAGNLEIALISRPLKPEEAAGGLIATEYGRSPFVFVTNRTDLESLTLQEATDIVAARKSHWPDGSRIRLVLRPAADIDSDLLAAIAPGMREALAIARKREGMVIAVTDQDAATEVERLPGGIGTSTLALVRSEKRNLKILALEGVQPSPATIADGRYRSMKTMYAVTRSDPSALTRQYIEFLRSSAARKILVDNAHWIPEQRDQTHGAR